MLHLKVLPAYYPPTWRKERKEIQGCLIIMGGGGNRGGQGQLNPSIRQKEMGTLLKASQGRLRAMGFDRESVAFKKRALNWGYHKVIQQNTRS